MTWTSEGNHKADVILPSTENIDDDDGEEDSFTAQKLFSFAWQIARGMVFLNYHVVILKMMPHS